MSLIQKSLTGEILRKVNDLFSTELWVEIAKTTYGDLFHDFCTMIEPFNEEQQKLIIELAHNFIYYPIEKYQLEIYNLIAKLIKLYPNVKFFNMFPILNDSDSSGIVIKSSGFLLYHLKSNYFTRMCKEKSIKFNVVLDIKNVSNRINQQDGSKIVLIDDFIGSGETVDECLKRVLSTDISNGSNIYIDPSKIVILCFCITEVALNQLLAQNYTVIYNNSVGKGIGDSYKEHDLDEKYRLMKEIEEFINVESESLLGRKTSESLVSMLRTPNNTFPVFWKDSKKNNPIFPRL